MRSLQLKLDWSKWIISASKGKIQQKKMWNHQSLSNHFELSGSCQTNRHFRPASYNLTTRVDGVLRLLRITWGARGTCCSPLYRKLTSRHTTWNRATWKTYDFFPQFLAWPTSRKEGLPCWPIWTWKQKVGDLGIRRTNSGWDFAAWKCILLFTIFFVWKLRWKICKLKSLCKIYRGFRK